MTNNKTDKPQKPTHAALPLDLYLGVLKTISQLPWEQANPLMAGLQQAPQITLDQVPNNDRSISPARS
jgi:hypothetical protein